MIIRVSNGTFFVTDERGRMVARWANWCSEVLGAYRQLGRPRPGDWQRFVSALWEHHAVMLPEEPLSEPGSCEHTAVRSIARGGQVYTCACGLRRARTKEA